MSNGGAGAAAVRPPRHVRAPNASPLTLDGTRTYLVGVDQLAIIDPGPALPDHLSKVTKAVGDARVVTILLTHGHPDHAAAAAPLSARLHAPVRSLAAGTLQPGDVVATDAGDLVAVPTPGHASDHVAFHWPHARAAFCGDLMLGGQDSTLVALPEGHLAAYLASLERLRSLDLAVIYPAHGEPFTDPGAAIAAYIRHREQRRRQVLDALAAGPATEDELAERIYGPTDPGLRAAAIGATQAYLIDLEHRGQVRALGQGHWGRT